MAGFLYYLPGKGAGVSRSDFQAAKIGYAWPEGSVSKRDVRGPDDQAGVVVANEKHLAASRVGYYNDTQQWRQVPGSNAWVGFYTEDRPSPEDLLVSDPLDGHWVRLADEGSWLAPVARRLLEQDSQLQWRNELPTTTTIDEQGNWQRGDVVERYRAVWQVASNWWDAAQAAETQEDGGESRVVFDFAGANDAALTLLQANYRIGKTEVAMLELFDDRCTRTILDAAVDWPSLVEFVKKNQTTSLAADSSSITAGQPDEAPTTNQP